MLKFIADENFNNAIVRGLLRRQPDLDIARVQDIDLSGADDDVILDWAAKAGRVILTHDAATFPRHAYLRVDHGQTTRGVFVASADVAISQAI